MALYEVLYGRTGQTPLCWSNKDEAKFEVGGERGWVKPNGTEPETYNEWAEQNRFHIGDTIYFKYQNDSVLEVNREDYENCSESNPTATFEDGNTIIKFDRSGFYYFISGKPGHCEAGQKIIIRVMVQSWYHWTSNAPAPSPEGEGPFSSPSSSGDGGHDGDLASIAPSSTANVASVTSFMTTLAGVLVFLYLFMS
ncbi:hypothetical protein Ancab_024947 [Ancistrocladus abbreviatus]